MKYLMFIASLFLLLVVPAFASEVIVFNDSKNDVVIIYKSCMTGQLDGGNSTGVICSGAESTIIYGTANSNQKNYKAISQHFVPDNQYVHARYDILIMSAKEVDNVNHVVAQGNFTINEKISLCYTTSDSAGSNKTNYKYNNSLILFDHHGSPYITCQENNGVESEVSI